MKTGIFFVLMSLLIFNAKSSFALTTQSNKNTNLDIIDPNHLLERVDYFIGSVTFEEAFKCGDQSKIETTQPNGHTRTKKTVVKNCHGDSVVIAKHKGFLGLLSDNETLNRSEFENAKSNMLRLLLASMYSSPDKDSEQPYVFFKSALPTTFSLESGQKINALSVVMGLGTESPFLGEEETRQLRVVIAQDVPAIAQILEMQFLDETGNRQSGSLSSQLKTIKSKEKHHYPIHKPFPEPTPSPSPSPTASPSPSPSPSNSPSPAPSSPVDSEIARTLSLSTITKGGTACADSLTIDSTEIQKGNLSFIHFMNATASSVPTSKRDNCSIAIPFQLNAKRRMVLSDASMTSSLTLSEGSDAQLQSEWFLTGSQSTKNLAKFSGPIQSTETTSLMRIVGASECGASGILRLNHSQQLNMPSTQSQSDQVQTTSNSIAIRFKDCQ